MAPEIEDQPIDPAKLLRDQVEIDSMDLNFVNAYPRRSEIDIPEDVYPRLASIEWMRPIHQGASSLLPELNWLSMEATLPINAIRAAAPPELNVINGTEQPELLFGTPGPRPDQRLSAEKDRLSVVKTEMMLIRGGN